MNKVMEEQEKQSQLVGNFSEMVSVTNLFLSEFEKVFGNTEIKKSLPTVEGVYMYAIIMHLGKIYSKSSNEHFSLDKFKNLFPETIERVNKMYDDHKDIIGKVKSNRDKLFAHTDKDFLKLGFSQAHIDKLRSLYQTDFSRIKAVGKEQERYTPVDLGGDLAEIKQMLQEADKLWWDCIMLIDFENKQNVKTS
ncbi:MAG: hypothetical protein AAB421_00760 [Patescibacteria group bacterium]